MEPEEGLETRGDSGASFFAEQPDLLEPFRQGRRDVLERVYRFHVRAVERHVRALARASGVTQFRQSSAIADLLQEVFIRAFSASARAAYDGVRDYQPYLNTIARNCYVDMLRTWGREVPNTPEALPLHALEETAGDDDIDPGVRAALSEYIAGLSVELRGIYEQRFVLGRSQEDAAAALGFSRRGLRTGEQRLRRGLRKALLLAGLLLEQQRQAPSGIARSRRNQPA